VLIGSFFKVLFFVFFFFFFFLGGGGGGGRRKKEYSNSFTVLDLFYRATFSNEIVRVVKNFRQKVEPLIGPSNLPFDPPMTRLCQQYVLRDNPKC
jgi:bacteriorhodopsin